MYYCFSCDFIPNTRTPYITTLLRGVWQVINSKLPQHLESRNGINFRMKRITKWKTLLLLLSRPQFEQLFYKNLPRTNLPYLAHRWEIWKIRKLLFIVLTNCITENNKETWEYSWIGTLLKEKESTENVL